MENIIEYLIPLILILAYVFPKTRKKKKQQEQPNPVEVKEKKPGLFSKLNKIVEEYYESDQDVSKRREQKEEEYDWYQDRPDYEDEEESEPEHEEPAKPVPEIVKTEEEVAKQKTKPLPVSRSETAAHQSMPLQAKSPLYASANVTNQDLRKAIIWSEILAPPKALRDE